MHLPVLKQMGMAHTAHTRRKAEQKRRCAEETTGEWVCFRNSRAGLITLSLTAACSRAPTVKERCRPPLRRGIWSTARYQSLHHSQQLSHRAAAIGERHTSGSRGMHGASMPMRNCMRDARTALLSQAGCPEGRSSSRAS